MIKTLIFNNEEYAANKIIKDENSIVGYDEKEKEIFSFKGISNFSKFILKNDAEFDVSQEIEQEELLSKILLENSELKQKTNDLEEMTANLMLEIAEIKGGTTNV